MQTSRFAAALAAGPVPLDGGLATLLEAHGHDLSSSLWSARLLLDDPQALVSAHREFFAAGARVATTASYQVSVSGFEAAGLSAELADRALRRSVELAAEARAAADRPELLFVAASLGPYGATLADGSEYRGDYGLDVRRLRDWHAPRFETLAAAGADVLAVETVPCLAEVEALCRLLAGSGVPAWLSVTAAGGRTRAGEPVEAAFELARDVDEIVAVGVNCLDPAEVPELLALARDRSGKPGVAYPNSGETWDGVARSWRGSGDLDVAQVPRWLAAGACAVGGCCRVGPDGIRAISRLLAADPG
ncbi:homocysteine S-methyltransferase [Nakamurella endophytica]|uniref:Homocysteine S-methyltransferase n=1 Tax=Nakamurella endophytica TaxID=1748367 RepID=A0A917SN61_9ACTN|nr:homocysteine S-methyltransferase [Nakamurella endophytica]GGL87997.1 homocysteine S-methyltransferase [Nakamurella endophytica]